MDFKTIRHNARGMGLGTFHSASEQGVKAAFHFLRLHKNIGPLLYLTVSHPHLQNNKFSEPWLLLTYLNCDFAKSFILYQPVLYFMQLLYIQL